ncbi:MAG TPA: hypothetical protein VFT75_09870 [Nocardioidaceae bacterium]|jgi:hypothetical protein|nr:hypothetical protein [Nocardioidaceae bacterium]
MENASELLMLQGVWAQCADCGSEQVFLPIAAGEFCCTGCDAAVFLVEVLDNTGSASAARHVA